MTEWLGGAQFLFIPVDAADVPGYLPPPAGFFDYVQRRVHYDPDPVTGRDRSISRYFADISYGRASLDARVSRPVEVHGTPDNITLAAINAQPNSHLYRFVAVVLPANRIGTGGMAAPGRIPFEPPRSPNRTKGRTRFTFDENVGTWAMEIMHVVTGIGDYYNGIDHPRGYDLMANNHAASHPSAYTKLQTGWLDRQEVPDHAGARKRYTVHAIALPHPVSAGRVAAVKVQAPGSDRYLLVEARLRSDQWDRGFTASPAIPEASAFQYEGIPPDEGTDGEGVVVYEFSPQSDPWPRKPEDPNGPWPPLELRAVLSPGESFTHFDPSTPTGVRDHRSGIGRDRTVSVRAQVAGGFEIDVETDQR